MSHTKLHPQKGGDILAKLVNRKKKKTENEKEMKEENNNIRND